MTRSRGAVSVAVAGTVIVVAGRWAPSLAVLAPRTAGALGIRTRFPDLDGVVLTFDDGPHPDGTEAVLAELERASARAIFFVTGVAVAREPRLAREIVAAGHELGVHGYHHQSRRQWTERAVAGDTRRALSAIGGAASASPRFYRPPHGTMTFAGRRAVRGLGLEPLLWSRWGKDWRGGVAPHAIASSATRGIARGDVVLLHDSDAHGAAESWRSTAAALPHVLDAIDAAGHRVVLPGP